MIFSTVASITILSAQHFTICLRGTQQAWWLSDLLRNGAGLPSSDSDNANAAARDGLGWACYALHLAILVYILIGWLLRPLIGFYLLFLPAMAVHWRLNANTCAINNLETLIRTGHWRDPQSPDEGAWVNNLIRAATGLTLTRVQNNLLTHAVLVVLWGLGLWRWRGW